MKLTSHVDAIERAVRALGAFPLPRERIGVSQMKTLIRSCFVLPVLVVAFISATQTTVAQQVQFYVHELEDLPEPDSGKFHVHGTNENLIASGVWNSSTGPRGFFYQLIEDAGSPSGYFGQYNGLSTVLDLPADWTGTRCYQINNLGIGIGLAHLATGELKGFWFDLTSSPPGWNWVPEPNVPGGSPRIFTRHLNDDGDIIVAFEGTTGDLEGYVFNPILGEPPEYLYDQAGQPIILENRPIITDNRVVIGNLKDDLGVVQAFTWESAQPLQVHGHDAYVFGANNPGQFTGEVGPNGFLYEPLTNSLDLLDLITDMGGAINDDGDIVGVLDGEANAFLYRDGNLILLDDIVVGDNAQFFRDSTNILFSYANTGLLTNRNATGYGLFSCRAEIVSTAGSGKNKTTVVDQRHFILIPEELPPPPNPLIVASADTPKSIPDNNTTGVTSTIGVAHDVTITNLTVTLNISHPRMSDLQATLIGPNGTVPLTNLTGLNNVDNFDGTSSQGNWRVKVVDRVRKQTGTLNGWTLSIEH